MQHEGKVDLVGAGPGDPGLLTLRGRELLQQAEVVVYDYLANAKLLRHAPKDCIRIYVGKKGGGLHACTQEHINRLLVEHARAGRTVVRLKGGDPFIFGRGGEEIEELAAYGIAFEAVPGVTAASAAATYTGIPITHRRYTASVAFITGHEDPDKPLSNIDWNKLATGAGTLVIYMGIKNLPDIAQKLMAAGRRPETPAAVVRWASMPQQESVIGTLADIGDRVRAAAIKPPALVIVGEVVQARGCINWFEKRPLFGRRIVVTRTREQASALVSQLENLGADCLECPTIEVRELADYSQLDAALERLADFDWLLFTSPNTVQHFFRRLQQGGQDSRALYGLRIAAVGSSTAEALRPFGLRADFLPEKYTGEALAEALIASGFAQGQRFLLPQAAQAGKILPDKLRAAGATVMVVPAYETVPATEAGAELQAALDAGAVDCITFTSSSTVRNCFALLACENEAALRQALARVRLAAIGPVTAKTIAEYGLPVAIMPERHTIADLVSALLHHFTRESPAARV